ncbi:MAG TPA: ABC transporter substrate-binding protein [Polyangiales bacterium]
MTHEVDRTQEVDPDPILEPEPPERTPRIARRSLLAGGAALLLAGAAGAAWFRRSGPQRTANGLRKLRLAWNANAICLSPALLAKEYGIYEKHGLDVELVNFAGSTDQLLEAISTGKADAGVGMIMRWIKPLEQGFDVRLIAGTHGGCARMSGSRKAGISDDPASLRGKRIGLAEISGASRNAFAVLLKKHGVDPERDVTWRQFPQPLLGEAIRKGEVDAIADMDPILHIMEQQSNGDLVEVLTNLTAPWENRVCCVVGASGELLREDRPAAKALADSLVIAASFCAENPDVVAKIYQPYSKATVEDIVWVLKSQTHDRHPVGLDLTHDIELYAEELRDVGVMRQSTVPNQFARKVCEDLTV